MNLHLKFTNLRLVFTLKLIEKGDLSFFYEKIAQKKQSFISKYVAICIGDTPSSFE